MFQLKFQNQTFSSIADFKSQSSDLPDFAKSALNFCCSWLEGNETFVQKTSGSTGIAKNIQVSREQMINSALATKGFYQTDEHTKMLCCLPPHYIAGKMMLVRAMVWNCEIELIEPSSNPLSEITNIPDFVAMVPLQVEKSIIELKSLRFLKKIENLIIGGAAISENLKSQILENSIVAFQTYGMTETVSHIALAKISSGNLLYQTLPSVEIGVDDRNTLWIKSPISGPNPIQTNDQVELLSSDSFRWLGRVDFVINSGGIKIHPELLEQKSELIIQSFFPNTAFFFAGLKDEKLGEKVILILESDFLEEKSARDLKAKLKSELNRFENPKEIFHVKNFVWTPNGKLDRLKTLQIL